MKAESWESTKDMLLAGEADIRMPATEPSTPSTTLEYTEQNIMDTYQAVMTLKTREDLFYGDYENFENMTIAISKNFYNVTTVQEYLADYHITEDHLLFCDGYDACREALDEGRADALISNVMDLAEDMKMLARFNSESNYISAPIGNHYLDEMNEALYQIKLEDPTLLADLYKKYFPERTIVPLTKNENEYIASLGTLKVAFSDEEGYLTRLENGKYVGIYPEIVDRICKKLGISYEQISMSEVTEDGGPIVLADCFFDYSLAQKKHLTLTPSYFTMNYFLIKQKNADIDEQTCKVAAFSNDYDSMDYLLSRYGEEQIKWYQNARECMDAVNDGDADITILNNYTAEYYLSMYQYGNLSSTMPDYSSQRCMAVLNNSNGLLASALGKMLDSISKEDLEELIIKSTSEKSEQNIWKGYFYRNPIQSAILMMLLVMIVTALIFMGIIIRRNQRQNKALQVATDAKSAFLARMSHDMRTPMNAIMGMTSLAMDERNNPDKIRDYLNKIDSSSQFLLGLINDTLDMDKIESGVLELNPEPYSMEEFKATIQTMFGPACVGKQLDYEIAGIPVDETILVDKIRFNQVFFNILSNAVKYTKPHGYVKFIMENQKIENQKLSCDYIISDNGIGMSEEFMSHMFDPFSRESEAITTDSTGSGLGLSIAKNLVDLMGGELSIESQKQKGTTVKIHLVVPLTEKQPVVTAGVIPVRNENVLEGKHVLLVEDHPLNTEIAKRLLEKKGMIVLHAENGKVAVDKFNASALGFFDVVLMDIRMPVMDGLEATVEIRALDRADASEVPIIAMTANAYDEDRKRSHDAGMNEHLAKPINPAQLYGALVQYLK